MNVLFILAIAAPLPLCHAITQARDSGARGALAVTVWTIEALAAQLIRLAAFLRAWHEFRKGRETA